MTVTIILIDDHPLFRKGLHLLLEEEDDLRVIGEAENGEAAIALAKELSPDVVLMDISLPDMDGIEATRRILSRVSDTRVMALSIHDEKHFIEAMFQAGAVGYALKEVAGEELVEGLRAVARGEIYLSHAIKDVMVVQYIDQLAGNSDAEWYADTFLITKLHRPQILKPIVLRSRLLAQLEQERERPLILISAPAGYGKSTLVSQWLETCDCPNAWISLDENDNDLRLFLTYFVAAVQTQFPEKLKQISGLLNAQSLPPLHIIVKTITNDLQMLPQPIILVLDDCHYIDEPVIFDFLSKLLRYPPQTLHLVLITRTDPMLDLLQLRASGKMGEVRAQGLSFTVDETASLLQNALGKPVETTIASTLTEKSEGWVTGLRLLTLSVTDSVDLEKLAEKFPDNKQTLDYLVAEAISNQPPEIQTGLLKTAILNRFCLSLCEAILSPADDGKSFRLSGNEFIEWLTKKNLFVISLDHDQLWFRYHHLFQDLLQNQLKNRLSIKEIADLHARAATWFAKNNLVEEAIQHALASGDATVAAQIVEQNRFAIMNTDEWYVLEKWLDKLPNEIRQQRPELLLAKTHALLNSTRIGQIPPILEHLQSLIADDWHEPIVLAEMRYFQGIVAYFQNDGVKSEKLLSSAIELLPSGINNYLLGQSKYWLSLARYLNGQKEMAIRRLKDNILRQNSQSGMITTRLIFGLCFIHMLAGEWAQVLPGGFQLKKIAKKKNLAHSESWGNYLIGYASLQIFDLDTARHYFSLVLTDRYKSNYRASVDAMAGLSLTLQFMGEANEADKIMKVANEFSEWTPDPGNLEIVRSCKARLALLRGDLESASRWQRSLRESAEQPVTLFFLENPCITQCRVLLALGTDANLKEAAEKLLQLRYAHDATHNICQIVEIVILQAMVTFRQERIGEALRILQEAIAMALPGSLLRPFIEAGQPLIELLTKLKKQGAIKGMANQNRTLSYIDQILSAFPAPALPTPSPISSPRPNSLPDLLDPLTKQELQVLWRLATSLSTSEIATQLGISIGTVRSHCRSIYSKLDVHSRAEASYRARELELI